MRGYRGIAWALAMVMLSIIGVSTLSTQASAGNCPPSCEGK